jgi:hypothetical protein
MFTRKARDRPAQDSVVSQQFVEEQTRVPFDFAQGRLSTTIGAKCAPISAQDDSLFYSRPGGRL